MAPLFQTSYGAGVDCLFGGGNDRHARNSLEPVHVRPQDPGNSNRAVLTLKVLHHRHDCPADGEPPTRSAYGLYSVLPLPVLYLILARRAWKSSKLLHDEILCRCLGRVAILRYRRSLPRRIPSIAGAKGRTRGNGCRASFNTSSASRRRLSNSAYGSPGLANWPAAPWWTVALGPAPRLPHRRALLTCLSRDVAVHFVVHVPFLENLIPEDVRNRDLGRGYEKIVRNS